MRDDNFIKTFTDPERYHDKGDMRVRNGVLQKFGGRCAYCGDPLTIKNLHVDHFKPLKRHELDRSKKGANNFTNYFPACPSCNSSKNTMDIETWRSEIAKKLDRLKRDSSTYRLCLRFGFVKEKMTGIVFHFEKYKGGVNG
jgi:5-methylcytosine-specific restriction endonuclease McrA